MLGVRPMATIAEVREAFQRQAWNAHPDNGGSSTRLQEVVHAFEELSGPRQPTALRAAVPGTALARASKRQHSATARAPPGQGGNEATHTSAAARSSHEVCKLRCGSGDVLVPGTRAETGAAGFNGGSAPHTPAVARICRTLERLRPERRRALLARSFSESQRRSLEQWLLRRRGSGGVPWRAVEPLAERQPAPAPKSRRHDKGAVGGHAGRSHSITTVVRHRGGRTYRYYFASTTVGGLYLLSRTDSSLRRAIVYHMVLLTIRQRTAPWPTTGEPCSGFEVEAAEAFDACFRKAVLTTLDEFGVTAVAMGLKFIVSFRALWIKTPLRTPAYSVPAELEVGLAVRRRLALARGAVPRHRSHVLRRDAAAVGSWMRLRDEYLQVMVEAGCPRDVVLTRLQTLDKERASRQQQQVERWHRLPPALAEVRPRRQVVTAACKEAILERHLQKLLARWPRTLRLPS